MVTSIAQTVNLLIEKMNRLEKIVDSSQTPTLARSLPDAATSRVAIDGVEKRVALLESSLPSQAKTTSHEAIVKTLADEVKMLKATMSDMNKERVLLETALTHKLELHANRLLKERVDAALKEQKKDQHEYVDQSILDVKSLFNNFVSRIAAQQPALAFDDSTVALEPELPFQTEPLDIEALKLSASSDDFEIEIQTASSKLGLGGGSKRIIRKK
jgi:hypothetical protein